MIGSPQAVTEAGQIVCASATGSQLAAYGYGAQRVILIVGAQKIVPNLATALRRISEHCLPLESERAKKIYDRESVVAKTLVLDVEPEPGRTTIIRWRAARVLGRQRTAEASIACGRTMTWRTR